MPIPANAEAMKAAGYSFMDHGRCDACSQAVEWWRTPQGRQIPMNPMPAPTSPARGHWNTCGGVAHAAGNRKAKKTGTKGLRG